MKDYIDATYHAYCAWCENNETHTLSGVWDLYHLGVVLVDVEELDHQPDPYVDAQYTSHAWLGLTRHFRPSRDEAGHPYHTCYAHANRVPF